MYKIETFNTYIYIMSFHKNNEPYSFKQLQKIFYDSNCELTDIPIKCIQEFSQLPYKITMQINYGNKLNNKLNKTFYSSIVTHRFFQGFMHDSNPSS